MCNKKECLDCLDTKIDRFADIGRLDLANLYNQIKYQIEKELYPDSDRMILPPFEIVYSGGLGMSGVHHTNNLWRPFTRLWYWIRGNYPTRCYYLEDKYGRKSNSM